MTWLTLLLAARGTALLAALLLGLLPALLVPLEASACSCLRSARESSVKRADAIFTGQVLATTTMRKPAPARTDIRFEVSRVYKGTVYREQVVASPQGSDGCGIELEPGSTWVIFAEDQVLGSGSTVTFRLVTELCSGNYPGSNPPRSLGSGRAPLNGASDREERAAEADARYTRVLTTGGLVALGLVALTGAGLAVLWGPLRSRG